MIILHQTIVHYLLLFAVTYYLSCCQAMSLLINTLNLGTVLVLNRKKKYNMISFELLKDVSFPAAAMQYRNATCDDHSHLNEIILFYSEIISALTKASKAALSYHQNTPQYSQVSGWNKKIKSLHSAARYAFLTWVHNGRPKHGVYFEKMKVTRKKFKLSL